MDDAFSFAPNRCRIKFGTTFVITTFAFDKSIVVKLAKNCVFTKSAMFNQDPVDLGKKNWSTFSCFNTVSRCFRQK